MNNPLCFVSRGRLGVPKIKVGQRWIIDGKSSSLFSNNSNDVCTITSVLSTGFVKYKHKEGIEWVNEINDFRWRYTLVEDVSDDG